MPFVSKNDISFFIERVRSFLFRSIPLSGNLVQIFFDIAISNFFLKSEKFHFFDQLLNQLLAEVDVVAKGAAS